MKIFFGSRDFKIKEIHPNELGLIDDRDYHIEIRQKYFHIYWIPFFGLGKIWGIRRNGELYELPVEYIHEIKRRNIKVRSPWYTYALPILVLVGLLVFVSVEKVEDYQFEKRQRNLFVENLPKLDAKIENAKANEYFDLSEVDQIRAGFHMNLKVEKVYDDKILFTIIPEFLIDSSGLELEDCYLQNKTQLDTISILKSDLKKSFERDYDQSKNYTFKGRDLLKSGKLYSLYRIEEGFQPKLNSSILFKDYSKIQIQVENTGSGFTILSIKNTENTVPWDIKLPLKIKSGNKNNPSIFILSNKKQKDFSFYGHDIYKADFEIVDGFGIKHDYKLSGDGQYCSFIPAEEKKNFLNYTLSF